MPRFEHDNLAANAALINQTSALAAQKECSPGQIALAWLLAQHPWIVPIPGTRRTTRIQENAHATRIGLSADELADLDTIATRLGVHGDRYDAGHLELVNQ